MKSLLIVRHSKAEDVSAGINDFQRPLSARGRDEAAKLARIIRQANIHPELLLSSSARRTRETSAALCEALGLQAGQQLYRDDLYLAGEELMRSMLEDVDGTVHCCAIVGHNPGVSELLTFLCAHCTLSLPTSGAALLQLTVDSWSDLFQDCSVEDTLFLPE